MTTDFVCPPVQSRLECERHFREILNAVPAGRIAGGALRDFFQRVPNTSDVDVFFPNADALYEGICSIEKTEATRIYDNDHIAGYMLNGRHVQLVKGCFRETLEETISQFDFTVCTAGIDFDGQMLIHRDLFQDLAARKLAITEVTCPLGTLKRIVKYGLKGFTPDDHSLLKLAKALKTTNVERGFYGGSHRWLTTTLRLAETVSV